MKEGRLFRAIVVMALLLIIGLLLVIYDNTRHPKAIPVNPEEPANFQSI